jgi:putative Holliday junction resolvase
MKAGFEGQSKDRNIVDQIAAFCPTYNREVPSLPTAGERTRSRVLGLDVGSRRIGVAVSDLLGITAQGLATIQRRNKRTDLAALEKVINEHNVSEIVVGLPLRMSGAEGIQAEKMRLFVEELRKRFKLPVHLWDERLTSAQANRLLRETEMSIKRRGEVVDQMAAVLILQSWMEAGGGR